jgi:outer membrane protein TolC
MQVAQLEQLAEALSDAQEAGSNMRWELLAKEAALSSMAQQLADAEQTAARATAAQAVSVGLSVPSQQAL